jgi:hypothetical protein
MDTAVAFRQPRDDSLILFDIISGAFVCPELESDDGCAVLIP